MHSSPSLTGPLERRPLGALLAFLAARSTMGEVPRPSNGEAEFESPAGYLMARSSIRPGHLVLSQESRVRVPGGLLLRSFLLKRRPVAGAGIPGPGRAKPIQQRQA